MMASLPLSERFGGTANGVSYDEKSRLTQDATTGLSTHTHTYGYSYDLTDNRLTSNETGSAITWSYDAASRITTAASGAGPWTFSYSDNGNLSVVLEPAVEPVTMSYDMENRLAVHKQPSSEFLGTTVASYTYDGDGLKRRELVNGAATTLIWDGSDYLGEKS